jgi:ribosomal 50S subunit-recycling heat shock protein
MRLDLFLKLSRLCPRRTVAQKLCDAGFVFLNDRLAKSGHSVKVGDKITIRSRISETVARIREVPSKRSVSRHEAGQLLEIIEKRELKADL